MKTSYLFLFIIAFPVFIFAQNQDSTCICGKSAPTINQPIIVEIMAKYPGGKNALKELIQKNVKPDQQTSGKIDVTFLIGCKGTTCAIAVKNHSNIPQKTEHQLIKALKKMEVWKPAKQRNKPVDIPYFISLSITKGIIHFNRI